MSRLGMAPLEPPPLLAALSPGDWRALPLSDAVIEYLGQQRRQPDGPASWQAARFSAAAYLYREMTTGWSVVVKFYWPKTGPSAEEHAQRELERIREVRALGLDSGPWQAIRPLAAWRGVLFLEYVDGLTLADIIAVRRSQPGMLLASLKRVAGLLATVHIRGVCPEVGPTFEPGLASTHKYVNELEVYGVLQAEPLVGDRLRRLIDRWAGLALMTQFTPSLIHGDATTTNFIFPGDGRLVAIDWERLAVADPAADVGRLLAEVSHSISHQGGSSTEVELVAQALIDAYRDAHPAGLDVPALMERARFYRGSSTLRIARNGWLSREERTELVDRALALLRLD